jgi:HEAT repeat protein
VSAASGHNEEERYSQACALAELRPPELYEAARPLIADPVWRIRRAAWEALLRAEADEESRYAFLLRCLESEDDAGTRGAALEALISLGGKAVPFLLAALPSRSPRFQRYILDVLAQVRAPGAAEAALGLVTAHDENVGFAAAEVVGVSGTAAEALKLFALLGAADQTRRFSMLSAMVQIAKRSPFGLPSHAIGTFLDDPILRGSALELLGLTGDAAAGPLLWSQVVKGRPVDKVILALDRLRQRGFSIEQLDAGKVALVVERCGQAGSNADVRRAAFNVLADVAPAELGVLLPLLAEQDGDWLTERLLAFEDFRLRDLLSSVAVNPYGRNVAAVIYRLRPGLKGESALLALLNQPGAHRLESVMALASVGTLRAAPHLISLCADPDEMLAARAAEALQNLAKRGIVGLEQVIFKVIGDKPPSILALLLPTVGWLCESERARDLICLSMRDSDPLVRKAAVSSCEAIVVDSEVERMLVRCLADEDDEVRTAAAEVCGRAGVAAAAHALEVLLDDGSPWVASTALGSLARLGRKPAAGKVAEMLERGGIVAVAAAGAVAQSPVSTEGFHVYVALLSRLDDDATGELLKSLAVWPQEIPREAIETLWRSEAWNVRGAVVSYLEVKKPAWLEALGRDWLRTENDDWVRTRLEALVGI